MLHNSCGVEIVSFPFSAVTIGFNTTSYSVREDAGNVSVNISVQAGTLDRDVIVTLTTMNSTAMRECRKKRDNHCVKLISVLYFSSLQLGYSILTYQPM